MTGQAASLPTGIQATAAIVPGHYASEEQVSCALARLGKQAAAALIQGKLPTTKGIRSGESRRDLRDGMDRRAVPAAEANGRCRFSQGTFADYAPACRRSLVS